jgi:hypothetical protein
MGDPDDVIWVEEIDHDDQRETAVVIYKESGGTYSFSSSLSPLGTAKLFMGLANHIMENHVG